MHIVDVTDPENTEVVGVFKDPNTQVLDVKYLEYNGREYIHSAEPTRRPGQLRPQRR